MPFNPDLSKQAQEIVFSRKTHKIKKLKKLKNNLPRQSLLTIYKSFIRPHLDYGM